MNSTASQPNKPPPTFLYYELINETMTKFLIAKRTTYLLWTGFIFTIYTIATVFFILFLPANWPLILFVSTVTLLVLLSIVINFLQLIHANSEQQRGREHVQYCYNLLKDKEAYYQLDLQTITALEETAELYSHSHVNKPSFLSPGILVVGGAVLTWPSSQDLIMTTTQDFWARLTAGLGFWVIVAGLMLIVITLVDSFAGTHQRRNANFDLRVAIKIWKAEKSALEPRP